MSTWFYQNTCMFLVNPCFMTSDPTGGQDEPFALIWTTTPWSLPANQAICYGSGIQYVHLTVTNFVSLDLCDILFSFLKEKWSVVMVYCKRCYRWLQSTNFVSLDLCDILFLFLKEKWSVVMVYCKHLLRERKLWKDITDGCRVNKGAKISPDLLKFSLASLKFA